MARTRTITSDTPYYDLRLDAQPVPFFDPRNDAQQRAFDVYKNHDVVFLLGPAGTGKTHVAVYCALYDMFARVKRRRVDRIFITRPLVTAGEELGFLPGEIDNKVHPYMLPIYDCVGKMFHRPQEVIDKYFEITPLAYMRGRTFEHCVAILDEAQNCTNAQLKLFISRLGNGGKLIISGDTDQTDIGRHSALQRVVGALGGEPNIGVYRFSDMDIVRHPLVGRILRKWPK